MNVCLRNTFASLWLFFTALSLSAQGASFYFPVLNNVTPGSNRLVPLKAVNLDSAVALQMVVRWDPTVLRYIAIDGINLGDLNLNDFNTTRALDSGYVRLQWEHSSLASPGASSPDSNTIFRLRFNIIGPDTSSSPVNITELLTFPPTYFELIKVRPDGSLVAYGLDDCPRKNGFVAVGYSKVSAGEPSETELPLTVFPNPFGESCRLQFELDERADVQAFIADASGRIVYENNIPNAAYGQHGMVIEKTMLGAAGAYHLTLRAGRKIATRTLVLH
jgi:hypothetical protein